MRLLVLAVAFIAGCHRPTAPSFAHAFGARLAAVVKPGAVPAAVVAPQPITLHHTVATSSTNAPEPTRPEPTRPEPQVTVHHVDASRPTQFVLRGTTFGGRAFCRAYTTMDECTNSCTAMLRAVALRKPTDGDTKGCSCLEQDGGC